jgi:adenylate kinase
MQQASRRALPTWASFARSLRASEAQQLRTCSSVAAEAADVRWVFLGPPGVGKGTYASRMAGFLGVPHIAAGDLVRAEIKSGSLLGQQVGRRQTRPEIAQASLVAINQQQPLNADAANRKSGEATT